MKGKTVTPTVTKAQYERALKSYVTANGDLQTKEAELDEAVLSVNKKFEGSINKLVDKRDAAYETIFNYCTQNRGEMFADDKKSVDAGLAVVSFTLGKPRIAFDEGVSGKSVVAHLKKARWHGKETLIVTKEELSKTAILKCQDEKILKRLEGLGVSIVQDEHFNVKVKTL